MNKIAARIFPVCYSIIVFLCVFSSVEIFSQTLTVSTAQLNFGNVYENAPDSLQLTLFNNLGHAVNVTGMKFYNTYGSPAFSANESNFNITDGSSHNVWIKFSPRHNIFHNSELVIENDALRGYVSVDLMGQGKYSNAYYDSTENLSEENLKTILHSITGTGYVSLGYNLARDSMFMWLDNQRTNSQGASQNTLEGIYTGILAVGYLNRTDCQNTFGFNTEHTFPQAFFNSLEPMKSDLHHLFPTDNASNNYRADNPFGVVPNPAWTSGGSSGTTTLFEPRNQQKGATSRAMMYFILRYQDYNNFFALQETILRTWHQNFPPTAVEQKRNNDIDSIQHNRNPFVDYPQFIERITVLDSFSVAPVSPSIDLTEDTIIYGFVPQSMPNDFHYVIVNNGNTDVHFTNFTLSNSGLLNFQSGGVDTMLAPGDALVLTIRLVTSNSNSIHETLNFQTDVPGFNAVSVPIYANDSSVNGLPLILEESIFLNPNPVKTFLVIHYPLMTDDVSLAVIDVTGKTMKTEQLRKNNAMQTLNVSMLSDGMYFLKIENKDKVFFRKFIKQ